MIFLPPDSWEIKNTQNTGRGVFASINISPGTVIGDYLGKVIKTAEDPTAENDIGLYLMYYHDYASIYPTDINSPGVHLINHSCTPNCWMYIYKGHTLFFSLRKIFAGEELTISYQLASDPLCDPCTHTCFCGSAICSKTMHLTSDAFKKWNEFSIKQSQETKKARIRYGKELAKLSVYPETIPDNPIYPLIGFLHKQPIVFNSEKFLGIAEIRKIIRETGRTIQLLDKKILGVKNEKIIFS